MSPGASAGKGGDAAFRIISSIQMVVVIGLPVAVVAGLRQVGILSTPVARFWTKSHSDFLVHRSWEQQRVTF